MAFASASSLWTSFTTRNVSHQFPVRFSSHKPHRASKRNATRMPLVARVRRGPIEEPSLHDSLHDIPDMPDIDWKPFNFKSLEGKVVYVVNVACQDSFTHDNYQMISNLITEFRGYPFVVLAFPSNWFGQKETWPNDRIKTYVHEGYSPDILLMDKIDYETNPVFVLGQSKFPGEIHWNFHGKFIFDRSGKPVARFDLKTSEDVLSAAIRAALGSNAPPPRVKADGDGSEKGIESKELGEKGIDTAAQEQMFAAAAAGSAAASAVSSFTDQELGVDQTEGSE